jgi:hypothetical protein
MIFLDTKIKNLISKICVEHLQISKLEDSNIGYLWYMYNDGSRKGDFKPFIFLAEINLLIATNYLAKEEKENMLNMLTSNDEDNAHILAYCILQLRDQRIKEKGSFTKDNPEYAGIEYITHVFSPEHFLTHQKG